jgi:hypothetical protein
MTASIWRDGREIRVKTPYSADWVDAVKRQVSKHLRRFDPAEKIWIFDPAALFTVRTLCHRYFDSVHDETEVPPPPPPRRELRSPYQQLLEPLPMSILKKVHRLIIGEVHPDRGGDTRTCQEVNRAWDAIVAARGGAR